jgi:hypothetical protein
MLLAFGVVFGIAIGLMLIPLAGRLPAKPRPGQDVPGWSETRPAVRLRKACGHAATAARTKAGKGKPTDLLRGRHNGFE